MNKFITLGLAVVLTSLSTFALANVSVSELATTTSSNKCIFTNDVPTLDSILQNNSCAQLSDSNQAAQCMRIALSQAVLCRYAQGLNSNGGFGSAPPPLPPVSAKQHTQSAHTQSQKIVQAPAATQRTTNNKKSTFNWF